MKRRRGIVIRMTDMDDGPAAIPKSGDQGSDAFGGGGIDVWTSVFDPPLHDHLHVDDDQGSGHIPPMYKTPDFRRGPLIV